jgi:hypothetical protein
LYDRDTFYSLNDVGYADYPTYEDAITKGFAITKVDGEVLSYKEELKKTAE